MISLYQKGLICVGAGYKEANLHKWGPGCRDIYSLHYVISGRGYIKTRDKMFTIEEGQSFLIYPKEEYYYYPDEGNPWEYVWIDFHGQEGDRLVSLTGFSADNPTMTVDSDVRTYYNVIVETKDRIQKEEQERAKLHFLLTKYFRKGLEKEQSHRKDYIQLAEEYVSNYFWRSDLSIPEIAEALHIDRTYLYRLVKGKFRMSPSQYLTEFRIEKAGELLEQGNLPIQTVAGSVGYEDALYFSKIFKKIKGVSPSDYRKRTQLPLERKSRALR